MPYSKIESPSVAIIIASLYDDEELHKTIESCLSQIEVRLQIIVSLKYKTEYLLKEQKIIGDHEVIIVKRDDLGIANAWNNAIELINSNYVNFLGAGDYFCSSTSISSLLKWSNGVIEPCTVLYGDQFILKNRAKNKTPYSTIILTARKDPSELFRSSCNEPSSPE